MPAICCNWAVRACTYWSWGFVPPLVVGAPVVVLWVRGRRAPAGRRASTTRRTATGRVRPLCDAGHARWRVEIARQTRGRRRLAVLLRLLGEGELALELLLLQLGELLVDLQLRNAQLLHLLLGKLQLRIELLFLLGELRLGDARNLRAQRVQTAQVGVDQTLRIDRRRAGVRRRAGTRIAAGAETAARPRRHAARAGGRLLGFLQRVAAGIDRPAS
jgi:hypothetical protein